MHFSSLSVRQESVDFEKTRQWDSLLDLTYAVWRVCDVTMDNEFLKSRIKQNAADILTAYAAAGSRHELMEKITEQINTQIALLSLAQRITSAKEINFVILKNEYKKFNSLISYNNAILQPVRPAPVVPPQQQNSAGKSAKENAPPTHALNDRQVKIVQFFAKSKEPKIKLKDIMRFFPNLTDRTIRNDLKDLGNKKIIARSDGFGQASYYYQVKK